MAAIRKTTITKKIVPTDEDKILNNTTEKVISKDVLDVFNKDTVYYVQNIPLENKPTIMSGTMIEQFFDYYNSEAKEKLQTGAKKVFIYEKNNEDELIPLYKIEVVK